MPRPFPCRARGLIRPVRGAVLRLTLLGVISCLGGCDRPLPAAQSDATAQREDLVAFEESFLAIDRSYSPEARARAEARITALRAEAGSISDARFLLDLSQVVALADNGHTRMLSLGRVPAARRAGIRLASFGTEFYVLRATADHADLLGGRLVAIDGTPVAQLRDSAHTLIGGIASLRDQNAPPFLESPGLLYAMGLSRSPLRATYRFVMRDGSTRNTTLTPVASFEEFEPDASVAALDPAAGTSEPNGWRTLLSPDRAPWALQDFSETLRRRDAPEYDAIVIQLRTNEDAPRQSIAAFLEQADSARRAAGRKNVVLDMRFNPGGNLLLTREFMSSLPGRLPPDGRVIVLTSPGTFSAAISSTGYVKQAGGARVTLVGEAPGDRLRFWAEGTFIELPQSGAEISFATLRHDYLTGCRGFTDCHKAMVRYPIAVSSLAPDVPAPWTIEAYAAGRDPGMEAVARLLRPQ